MAYNGPLDQFAPANWPWSDREWARNHVDCNVTTCPNGKCRATGECVDAVVARAHVKIAERHTPISPLKAIADDMAAGTARFVSAAPPLVPFSSVCDNCIGNCAYREGGYCPARTLIAFTGLAGAGKSTAAAHLVNSHGFTRVRFAGPLKAMMAALGCTPAQIDGSEKEVPCDLLCGKTPRQVMQWLGTELGRDLIGADLWNRAWQTALAKVPGNVVVDDCRFPNELAAVTAAGGVAVRIERPRLAVQGYQHSSETHQLPAAATLHNTGSERDLLSGVDVLLRDLPAGDTHASL